MVAVLVKTPAERASAVQEEAKSLPRAGLPQGVRYFDAPRGAFNAPRGLEILATVKVKKARKAVRK